MKEKILLLIAIVCSCIYFTSYYLNKQKDTSSQFTSSINYESSLFLEDEKNNIQVYNSIAPSVVNVTCLKVNQPFSSNNESSGGSGFIWDKKGHIVTNLHVINNTRKILVSLQNDNTQYPAKIIGFSSSKDIAVLKIDASESLLKAIPRGSSSQLMVGQKAIALGNPFGLDHTLTTGIISALNRTIDALDGIKIHGIIQTDASINPGNSGGPLMDSQGKLIGMNTAIISKSGTSAGLGLAVPVDTIKRIVPQLIEHGKEIHPKIGIEIENRVALKKGLLIKAVTSKNAKLSGIRGYHRDSFGWLHLGDILLKIDQREINSISQLYHTLGEYKIGDTISITFLRENQLLSTRVKLSSN